MVLRAPSSSSPRKAVVLVSAFGILLRPPFPNMLPLPAFSCVAVAKGTLLSVVAVCDAALTPELEPWVTTFSSGMPSSGVLAMRSVPDCVKGWKPWNFGKVGDCGCFDVVDMRAGRGEGVNKEGVNDARSRRYGLVKNVQPAAGRASKREDKGRQAIPLLVVRLAAGEYLESGIILKDVRLGREWKRVGGKATSFRNDELVGPRQ